MASVQHLAVKIYGKVQGVGFRYAAREKAEKLDLVGAARNNADGSLHIEVQGDDNALQKFLTWCGKGPWSAKVERIEAEFSQKMKDFKGFSTK